MSRYTDCIQVIRTEPYGRQVRQAIADALSGIDTGLPDMANYYNSLLLEFDNRANNPPGTGQIYYQLIKRNNYRIVITGSTTTVS